MESHPYVRKIQIGEILLYQVLPKCTRPICIGSRVAILIKKMVGSIFLLLEHVSVEYFQQYSTINISYMPQILFCEWWFWNPKPGCVTTMSTACHLHCNKRSSFLDFKTFHQNSGQEHLKSWSNGQRFWKNKNNVGKDFYYKFCGWKPSWIWASWSLDGCWVAVAASKFPCHVGFFWFGGKGRCPAISCRHGLCICTPVN